MQTADYVGIDLHRHRSVIVRRTAGGETLSRAQITNCPLALADAVRADVGAPVVLEATYGWYWAADVLTELGCEVHLARPLGNNWGHRRVKNDENDATDLADLLRLGRLAEAWIAPPEVREQREVVRFRHKLVEIRLGLKAQVHAVLAKNGVHIPVTDIFGVGGRIDLTEVDLAEAYRIRVDSLIELIDRIDDQVERLDRAITAAIGDRTDFKAIQAIPGVGPVMAAIFVVEIGDVHRFPSPDKLCSWAGLTPRHRESDTKVQRGSITKQGSRLVRWAAVEAVARNKGGTFLQQDQRRIAARRGNKIARVAAARKLLTLVYYGMRDGHIRCLAPAPA